MNKINIAYLCTHCDYQSDKKQSDHFKYCTGGTLEPYVKLNDVKALLKSRLSFAQDSEQISCEKHRSGRILELETILSELEENEDV